MEFEDYLQLYQDENPVAIEERYLEGRLVSDTWASLADCDFLGVASSDI